MYFQHYIFNLDKQDFKFCNRKKVRKSEKYVQRQRFCVWNQVKSRIAPVEKRAVWKAGGKKGQGRKFAQFFKFQI